MRLLLTLLLVTLSGFAVAEEEKAELPPVDPAYHAEHPMALLNQGSSIFAINLPTYKAPHDVQVVYKIENPDVAFLELVRNADLITLKPQAFNIQHLMRGAEITITADVFDGDYKQGGSLIYSNREIVMSKKLYSRELTNLTKSSQWQNYDLITLKGTKRIYIHKIQQAPSYNHLIFVDLVNACMQKLRTSKRVPAENELTYKFINCGTLKPLYYNADNFKK
ncbi:hypothetical protein EU510_15275 [Pseudoalteromonas sp. FUC4]|uniref:hypothetical protein n=1 Tax=Pseudoalteromonas sp. FUC4 TaxID=2511201 RepID=UPI0011F2036F|nr:hypothetical protein [Pseudoalteromonas sp. FUC4]KAA1151208.1 hypothetical protein EU510_15275 [Pseudoalteromonas sp. FUC4]